MKNFSTHALLIIAAVLFQCADDQQIEPNISDDIKSKATLYADQFFTIAITTKKVHPDETIPAPIEFFLRGNGGRVSVNWGDGTIEKMNIGDPSVELSHQYERIKNYYITISGDIKTITGFRIAYQEVKINDMHFGGLVNLEEVGMNLMNEVPAVINLSRNRKLSELAVVGLKSMEDVLLPTMNQLREVDISGDNKLTTAAVDRIIARVHDAVVNSPRPGIFNLLNQWWQEEGDNTMVGPPSSYSINKLRKLRDTYGWKVNPNP